MQSARRKPPVRKKRSQLHWLQIVVHIGAWIPLAVMALDFYRDNLTVNPIQELTFRTGKTALVLLTLSLACTPVNTFLGFAPAIKVRRPLGVYAFLYALLHFLIFVWLDYGLSWPLIQEAIFEKRFALVGFSAFLLLLPLALTSTKGWMKRLGKNWTKLHKLVYLAAPLAVIHYTWAVKADIRQPLAFGLAVGLLLLARLPAVRKFGTRFRSSYRKLERTRAQKMQPAPEPKPENVLERR